MINTAHRIAKVQEYYFSRKLAEVRKLDTPDHPVINLGIGSPDLPPAPGVVEALARSAANPANHGYQSYKGIPALRNGIAEFYRRIYQVQLDPETMILPLMGSKEGIMHITLAFVNEGDEVLIPDPGYPTYSSVAKLAGASIRTYDLKSSHHWEVDLVALSKQDLSRVKLMWVNYPHMPTGHVASHKEMQALMDFARERGILIVNDNPYSLILNNSPLSLLSMKGAEGCALELNSLSKSHNMAGWRIGWVAGDPKLVDAVLRVKSNMDSGMFLGLQHAAVEALRLGPEWFEELNTIYKGRRLAASRILQALGCRPAGSQSGLFLWAAVPAEVVNEEEWLDAILYGARVFLVPGFIFGENGRRHVRISLCAPVQKMEEAEARIHQWKLASTERPSGKIHHHA